MEKFKDFFKAVVNEDDPFAIEQYSEEWLDDENWFIIDENGLGISCVFLAILQIVFIIITPLSYIFSEEKLIIRYLFGLEENIPWHHVRAITSHSEKAGRYLYLDSYKFYYYSKEKQLFYMQGVVSKDKNTKKLMNKYCPKKH